MNILIQASWVELSRLQQESDIFACQILEQDEELRKKYDTKLSRTKSKKKHLKENFYNEIKIYYS